MEDAPKPNETILPPLQDDEVRARLRGLRERMLADNEADVLKRIREVKQRAADGNPYPHNLRD